jgi:threonylcarbamoyladenosine tRNA methylthiotransferase MtaB
MYLLYYSTSKGISRSDELKCVKNAKTFRSKHQGNCFDGCEYWRLWKEFGNKKTRTYVLELVQELDKVEGIERLRISSIEPIY